MSKRIRNFLGPCVFVAALMALFVTVPATGDAPHTWRNPGASQSASDAVIANPAVHCDGAASPHACCTGAGAGATCLDFPQTYEFDPGRADTMSYQISYTCTTCDGSNNVTVTIECTIDENTWVVLGTPVNGSASSQSITSPILMPDASGAVTTNDVLCLRYRLKVDAGAGDPEVTALYVSSFRRGG